MQLSSRRGLAVAIVRAALRRDGYRFGNEIVAEAVRTSPERGATVRDSCTVTR